MMFAVPGWSVSNSAPKQQVEPASNPQKDAPPKSNMGSKKRKRGNDTVTKRNVDEMYKRHIEGHKPTKQAGNKPGKKGNKDAKSQTPKPQQEQELKHDSLDNKAVDGKPSANGEREGEGKKAHKRQKRNKGKERPSEQATGDSNEGSTAEALPPPPPPAAEAKLTPLQQAMRQKLVSSRFRHLNETLYTAPSAKAMELFTANPELFDEYHAGFSRQVKESWPINPVDGYVQAIRKRGAVSSAPKKGNKSDKAPPHMRSLPRRPNGGCTVTDLGSGDAQLANALTPSTKKLNLKLLSYDLHAPNSLVTKADISNLPVDDGSVDLAIFCLSLMGTNWVSFAEEAWRVLRGDGKGECWVSEVKSRFGKVTRRKSQIGAKKPMSKTEMKKQKKKGGGRDDDPGSDVDEAEIYAENARPTDGDETDISAFVEVFRTRGFVLRPESVDMSNKMFVRMEFVKQGGPPTKGKYASDTGAARPGKKKFLEAAGETETSMTPEEEASVLKPCVYKNR